jgi:N-hydroxyarylamine O-acetyltransferase
VIAFDTASFDLNAYLARIGCHRPLAPSLETLQALALAHPSALPFENLSPLLGHPVPLDVVSLQRKLLHDGRGGWCFEHNVLLGTALTALGFTVTGLAARVMWNVPAGATTARSHMVLRVDLDSRTLIVDAGFGGLTLTAPLRLEAGIEQETPHERFRLTAAGDAFIVEARIRDEWKALYRFDLQPQALVDYEISSWYLCTSPRSHFLSTLVAARVDTDRRYALRNTDFAIHHADGFTERRALLTARDLRTTLEKTFAIVVPHGPEMEGVFDRIIAAAAGERA